MVRTNFYHEYITTVTFLHISQWSHIENYLYTLNDLFATTSTNTVFLTITYNIAYIHLSVDINVGSRELTIFVGVWGGNRCTLNHFGIPVVLCGHRYQVPKVGFCGQQPWTTLFTQFPQLSPGLDRTGASPPVLRGGGGSRIVIPVDPKQCRTHVLFWQLLIFIKHTRPLLESRWDETTSQELVQAPQTGHIPSTRCYPNKQFSMFFFFFLFVCCFFFRQCEGKWVN